MSDLLSRLHGRPNDAALPTERLLDEAAEALAAARAALIAIIDHDSFPRGDFLTGYERAAYTIGQIKHLAREGLAKTEGAV